MSYYEDLKTRFFRDAFKGEKSKSTAIEKAYADMSRRAAGHQAMMKESCVNWLVNSVFCQPFSFQSQAEFDDWHKNTCEALKNGLNEGSSGNRFGTVGRAQKVVNMAFKYISCIDNTYHGILPYCHMTLDGYTLRWYRTFAPDCKEKEWSKLDDYDAYLSIQKNIRKHLKENQNYTVSIGGQRVNSIDISRVPFEAEFVIWEGEIIRARYDALIKDLNRYAKTEGGIPAGRERDQWLIDRFFDDFLRSYCDSLSKKQ